jgi:hypothetical protein
MVFRFPARDAGVRHSKIEQCQKPRILQQRIVTLTPPLAGIVALVAVALLDEHVRKVVP